MVNPDSLLSAGKRAITLERDAITEMLERIDGCFVKACELLLQCQGRVVVLGVGKSGHVGTKIAATLASTGTPALFVHPGEASHGDLGMITRGDVVLALSNSGNSTEILTLLPMLKRMGLPLIALTGKANSPLAQAADVHIDVSVRQEACPLNLAPTSSTTVTLVMGDALAVTLLEARGFTAEDFALSHPGGALGRRLLLHTHEIMHKDEKIPKVHKHTSLLDALAEISKKGFGMTTVVDENQKLLGLFTDGDLRRALDKGLDVHNTTIAQVMTTHPITIASNTLAAQALNVMETRKVTALVVADNGIPVGVVHMHDLLRAGLA